MTDAKPSHGALHWKSVAIPQIMSGLPVDPRGYPVPYIVQRDRDGTPHFSINDHRLVLNCVKDDLCSICGKKLLRGRWFVGGPVGALVDGGVYVDTPLHRECCEYALRVCPYMAAPRYAGLVGDAKWDKQANPDVGFREVGKSFAERDSSVLLPGRPEVFVAVMSVRTVVVQADMDQVVVRPARPFRQIEFWKDGVRLPDREGAEIAVDAVQRRMADDRLA